MQGVSPFERAQDVAYLSSIDFELLLKSAETRDWTRDLQIFSLTLSQLSYLGLATYAFSSSVMASHSYTS